MKKRIILFIAFLGSVGAAGQTCCSGGVPLSNNIGLPNEGKNTWTISLNYDLNNLNTLNVGTKELDDDSRKRLTHSVLLGGGYAFTSRFSAEILVSWVNQSRTISQFGNENFTETMGFGDTVLLLKYAFPDLFMKNSQTSIGVGTKIPTGDSDLKDGNGIQLTADLQPGSGAWDGLGWFSFNKALDIRPSGVVTASIIYRLTGENSEYLNNAATYEFGNEIQAQLGYVDEFLLLNNLVSPGLILKYRKVDGDRIDEQLIPNTGGDWIFIRPELNFLLFGDLSLSLRTELPLYSYVEGTQLTPTYRFTAGITYIIRDNRNDLNIIQ